MGVPSNLIHNMNKLNQSQLSSIYISLQNSLKNLKRMTIVMVTENSVRRQIGLKEANFFTRGSNVKIYIL